MSKGHQLIHSFNHTENCEGNFYGLTKREYFAGLAMQGLLTRVPERDNNRVELGVLESKRIAEESVLMADELLKALENE